MNVLLRLLRLYAPLTRWLAASIAIGALTALASVGSRTRSRMRSM